MAAATLIKNAWIVTNDDALGDIKNGSILIEGATIKAVGQSVARPEDCEVIDGTDMIVIPGFVDAHKHLWQTALRGTCGDLTLLGYFMLLREKFIAAYRPEDVRIGSYASAIEMINGGTTSVLDHAHCIVTPEHADAALEGVLASGIRGIWAYGYAPAVENAAFAKHEDRIRDARRVLGRFFGANDGRLRMGVSTTEQGALPFELTEMEVRSALDMNVRWTGHAHCGIAKGPHTRGLHKLYAKGLLNALAILSHCNEFSYNDFLMMNEVGAHFVSTPDTEIFMGINKPANYIDAIAAGTGIALGTDTVSCMSADMFAAMRVAMLFSRHQINGPATAGYEMLTQQKITVRDIFRWATINGAKAMGIDHLVGSLVPGKRADVVMVNTKHLNLMGVHDPVASLVINGQASNVDTVLIDGAFRKRGGALVGIDSSRLYSDLMRSQQYLVSRVPQNSERAAEHAHG